MSPADVRAMTLKRNLKYEDDLHGRRYELGGRKSWLELRIFARLELFGEFEFALGVFQPREDGQTPSNYLRRQRALEHQVDHLRQRPGAIAAVMVLVGIRQIVLP